MTEVQEQYASLMLVKGDENFDIEYQGKKYTIEEIYGSSKENKEEALGALRAIRNLLAVALIQTENSQYEISQILGDSFIVD